MSMYPARETLPDMIQRLAHRPDGVALAELVGVNVVSARTAIQRLRRDGRLHSGHVGNTVRYFATSAAALAWQQRTHPKPEALVKVSTAIKGGQQIVRRLNIGVRAWWDPNDPTIQPVYTERTIVTIAPPPPVPRRTNTHSEWGG